MKEHGSKLPAEQPAKILKSLLKKPGQSKARSHKNRVVINEKLNEFFAADYIILIKEECCADYEEDCDCCCQENELIRLGNCKECRAELNLHFGVPDNGRYDEIERDEDVGICVNNLRDRDCTGDRFGCVELQVEDGEEEEEEDEEEDEEVETKVSRDHEEEEEEEEAEAEEEAEEEEDDETETDAEMEAEDKAADEKKRQKNGGSLKEEETNEKGATVDTKIRERKPPAVPPPSPPPSPPQHQQETLSPPEGYKDVCCDNEQPSKFDYYQQPRATGGDVRSKINEIEEATRYSQEAREQAEESVRRRNEQLRRTTPTAELRHRYLVETITMTTVTERRIVREISEEERTAARQVDVDSETRGSNSWEGDGVEKEHISGNDSERPIRQPVTCSATESYHETTDEYCPDRDESADRVSRNDHDAQLKLTKEIDDEDRTTRNEKDMSLVFKLGTSSLAGNSLKPNSAVRQLFPNPRFVSPPPAPSSKLILAANSLEDSQDEEKFLVTTESLRMFDAVRRSNISEGQSESVEDETSLIKRTIERNTLRRSLVGKYRATLRKKNLPPKNLSLEERIRQLTCVDQEEEEIGTTDSICGSDVDAELLVRTSPSGQEEPPINVLLQKGGTLLADNDDHSTPPHMPTGFEVSCATAIATATMASTMPIPPKQPVTSHYQKESLTSTHASADNQHNQSTYKKLTDLFVRKRNSQSNMPDLGLGGNGKNGLGKEYQSKTSTLTKTNNSEVRKQFLASLAPLSCVAVNSTDSQEEYYRHNPRLLVAGNRDSMNYNSESPYSLEDIEDALTDGNCGYVGPPDVTRGTPTIATRPDIGDNMPDELLAFVEQDKSRTERIKRRYNEDCYLPINGYVSDRNVDRIADGENENFCKNRNGHSRDSNNGKENESVDNAGAADKVNNADNDEEDEDDELNDYGFNRRPFVRGIKPQTTDNSDGIFHRTQQSCGRSNENVNMNQHDSRTNIYSTLPGYYENNGDHIDARLPTTIYDETGENALGNGYLGPLVTDERDANTINRINTMQKQIDDIYQTIVESTSVNNVSNVANVSTQSSLESETYVDSTFQRQYVRVPTNDNSARFYAEQRNGQQYLQEQQTASSVPTLRGVAVGAEETGYPNNVSSQNRRREPVATIRSNYHCNVVPNLSTGIPAPGKCYRTMYFVPYNGLSDPTYQNIQRILPTHSSPNYASHIERYPYPRPGKVEQQLQPRVPAPPQPQPHHQPRYYHPQNHALSPMSNLSHSSNSAPPLPPVPPVIPNLPAGPRLPSATPPNSLPVHSAQQTLHLHLHHHQPPEDFRISGVAFSSVPDTGGQSLQLHHHQHQHRHLHQPMSYRLQTTVPAVAQSPSSSYTVIAPSRCATYSANGPPAAPNSYHLYQVHLGRTVFAPSSEIQPTQTFTTSSTGTSVTTCPASLSSTLSSSWSCSSSSSSSSSSTSSSSSSSTSSSSSIVAPGGIAPQQTSVLVLPNQVSESNRDTNLDAISHVGSNQCISNNIAAQSSSSNFTSAAPTSPTKLQQQRVIGSFAAAERGVPEGAASAPSHDTSQSGILLTSSSYITHNANGVSLPSHTQNSVYYAMNV